jgi:hypothetical protein
MVFQIWFGVKIEEVMCYLMEGYKREGMHYLRFIFLPSRLLELEKLATFVLIFSF